MGYTHYFKQLKFPTDTQWESVCSDFKRFCATAMLYKPFPIQREYHDAAPPDIDDGHIQFNGIGNMGHETMYLAKNAPGWSFCKTNRKPYDKAVMVLLVLAHHHASDVWEVTSDGEVTDWEPVVEWMNQVNGKPIYSVPSHLTKKT